MAIDTSMLGGVLSLTKVSPASAHLPILRSEKKVAPNLGTHSQVQNWFVVWNINSIFQILGISSSQLNSYFSEGWLNHQPASYPGIFHLESLFGSWGWSICQPGFRGAKLGQSSSVVAWTRWSGSCWRRIQASPRRRSGTTWPRDAAARRDVTGSKWCPQGPFVSLMWRISGYWFIWFFLFVGVQCVCMSMYVYI